MDSYIGKKGKGRNKRASPQKGGPPVVLDEEDGEDSEDEDSDSEAMAPLVEDPDSGDEEEVVPSQLVRAFFPFPPLYGHTVVTPVTPT